MIRLCGMNECEGEMVAGYGEALTATGQSFAISGYMCSNCGRWVRS